MENKVFQMTFSIGSDRRLDRLASFFPSPGERQIEQLSKLSNGICNLHSLSHDPS
jgi:hypothetical protein